MRELPNRIRCPRGPRDPLWRALTSETYQAEYLIAYAGPEYQEGAEAGAGDGVVTLDAVIGKDGRVQSLELRAGDPLLAGAALETARHWTFRPLLLNGRPVEVATEIDVRFTPPDGSTI